MSLTAGLLTSAFAQKDKRAEAILDAMSKKYKALSAYQAAFTYTAEGAGAKESYKGDLTVKDAKFRLKLGGQDVYNDGKTISTYIKESNEVNIQDYDGSANGDFNPTKIYSLYKKGFTYSYVGEQKLAGRPVDVIALTPEKKNAQIARVQISVDKADKSVRAWQITDKNGKRTSYTINQFTPNPKITDNYFVFDKTKYPGVEVVDLR